jgi:uncharacterized protein
MRTLLVDGYNVIAASPRYRRLAKTDLESARAALVSDVVTFAAGEYHAVVVFDGAGNPQSNGVPHHVPGALVIFSAYCMDADTVIEGLVHRHRERGESVVVATSDAQTQWTVLGPGVSRMPAGEFVAALESEAETWAEHNPSGSTRQTLDSRIDPQVREALSRWARGSAP